MSNQTMGAGTLDLSVRHAQIHSDRDGVRRAAYTVVVVNDHAFVNGGQAKVAIESAKALVASGLEVIFFAACGPVDDSLRPAGVRVVCLEQNDLLNEPRRL